MYKLASVVLKCGYPDPKKLARYLQNPIKGISLTGHLFSLVFPCLSVQQKQKVFT